MRLYMEKGQQFWDAQVMEDGEVTLVNGEVGGETTRSQESYANRDEAMAAVRAEAVARAREGWAEMLPPSARWQPEETLGPWYDTDFFKTLESFESVEAREPGDYVARVESYHAMQSPAELARFMAWRAAHATDYCNYGEWRIWEEDAWIPSPDEGNLFEQLALLDQRNYLGTAMVEYFASLICLGSAGNGDVYFAARDFRDSNRAEVLIWDHEEQFPYAFADGLSTLAWVNRVYTELEVQQEEGAVDEERIGELMTPVADRASLTWHYRDQMEIGGVTPEYEVKSAGLFMYVRAIYLVRLLQGRGAREGAEHFYEKVHEGLTFKDAVEGPYLDRVVSTALYWLWRLFFFKREEELVRCLEVCREHASPLVRDAVALIEELEAGRGQLGAIEDIHALREEFVALDLDPARAAERAVEQAAREQAEREAEEAQEQRAQELVATHSPEELAAMAIDELGSPLVLAAIREVVERDLPQAAPLFGKLRARDASERDFTHTERLELEEALTQMGPWRIPALLTAPFPRLALAAKAALRADAHTRKRVVELASWFLGVGTEYFREERQAVYALTILGEREAVPTFLTMLDELIWAPEDWSAEIKQKDVVWALLDGVGQLGDASCVAPMVALLKRAPESVLPRLLVNLGRLGGQEATEALIPALATRFSRPAMVGLSRCGTQGAIEALKAHLAPQVGGLELLYEKVMLAYAQVARGGALDEALVYQALSVIEPLKHEDRELQSTLAELLPSLGDRARAVHEAELLLQHPYAEVRQAALGALETMGQQVELRFADRVTVDELVAARDVEALIGLLEDPHAIFLHNVIASVAEHELDDEALIQACVDWARRVPLRYEHYLYGYVRDEHQVAEDVIAALAALNHESADRLLGALLGAGNVMYRDADTFKYDYDGAATRVQRYISAPVDAAEEAAPGWRFESLSVSPGVVGANVNALAWSPDGQWLAVGSEEGTRLLDREGLEVRRFASAMGWIYDVGFNPEGSLLAVGAHGGHLQLLDPRSGAMVANLKPTEGHSGGVRKLAFSPSGQWLASVSDDQTLRLWDVRGASEAVGAGFVAGSSPVPVEHVWTYEDRDDVNGVAWIDEERLVIITDNATHFIAREATGPQVTVKKHGGADVAVDVSRQRVYAAGMTKVRVFDLEGAELEEETIKQGGVARVRVGASGDVLYLASWAGAQCGVTRVDISAPAKPRRKRVKGHQDDAVFGMDLHPLTGEVYAAGRLRRVLAWSPEGQPLEEDAAPYHTDEVSGIICSEHFIYTASDDGTAIEWDRQSGRARRAFTPSCDERVCAVGLSEDGLTLVLSGGEFAAAFDLASGKELWVREIGRAEHLAVVGNEVVVADYDGLVWLSLEDGTRLHASGSFADSFVFFWARIDAKHLACAGYDDRQLFIWDLERREQVGTFVLPPTEKGSIYGLAAADGRLAISRWDNSVVVLDAGSGELVARVHTGESLPNPRWSPDGESLLAGEYALVEFDGGTYQRRGTSPVPAKISCLYVVDADRVLVGGAGGGLWWAHRA
ncbi:PQQ-binding-like beta-propeller repeat protein [Lujinxingia sediminis]|nr:PQQ-binding-like beta-propeller repeat protein [Lujinxingia sediminis]